MEVTSPPGADAALDLYVRLVPPSVMEDLRREAGWSGGGGLFSPALTIWLFVRQRLSGGGTLESTWLGLAPEVARALSPGSSRASKGRLSPHSSGWDRARRVLPLDLARAAARLLVAEARALLQSGEEPAYLLDGSSLTLENHPEIVRAFPPASNGRGVSHWPVVRMVVVHDLSSGLASVPGWGPMYGPDAVSEQGLAKRALAELPPGGLVIGDRNFGVFSVAWALRGRRALLRMTDARARALLGEAPAEEVDRRLVWRPSAADRRANPEVPRGAEIPGRLVVAYVSDPASKKPVRVCLFTNEMEKSPEELARLYARRWTVETDLRSLKREVGLEILRSRTPDTLAKELLFAVVAYDLVRALMALAARRKGLDPRRMSFTRARHVVLEHARRGPLTPERLEEILELIAARPLPVRKERKRPPRAVWRKAPRYPARVPEGR